VYIFKDKSITVKGHSCSIVVPIPNSTLLSALGSRNRTVIHNSLAQAIQMPSPALQKWIGLLEGLKHDRACLSCWLSAFQKYLTELLGFYLIFFWQFSTWGRGDNVALQVCKWSKSRTEYANLKAICKDCDCEAQSIFDMEEEEDQNARAWQNPFNIGPLVTHGDLVKTGASEVLKCTVCLKANHVIRALGPCLAVCWCTNRLARPSDQVNQYPSA